MPGSICQRASGGRESLCRIMDALMPELPEVETVVRGLRATLPGRRIVGVRLGKTDFIDDAVALERHLPGLRMTDVERYGKFIALHLQGDSGTRSTLLIHLGMTGQLTVRDSREPAPAHTHVWLALDNGSELRFTEVRRFGRIALLPDARVRDILGKLGADPLEISPAEFTERVARRRAMVKALLLDQLVLRGIGNIYADESLWRARIHPRQQADRLRPERIRKLLRALQAVLREAIRLRGSSVSDYLDAAGDPGEYQRRHRVYQREGKACFRCGATIRRVIVAGRSSYFCPKCQPAPRKAKRNLK